MQFSSTMIVVKVHIGSGKFTMSERNAQILLSSHIAFKLLGKKILGAIISICHM